MGSRSRSKLVIAIVSLSFLLILIYAVNQYVTPPDKQFGADNFYVGAMGDGVDGKALYESLYLGLAPGTTYCKTTMSKALNSETAQAGNAIWIAPIDSGKVKSISTYSDILSVACDDDTKLKPYNSGNHIISPSKLTFINSNVVQDTVDSIYIMAYINSKYAIRWDNVECWWCHEDKKSEKHTEVVGAKGLYSACTSGYVIGVAREDTTVTLYEVLDDGTMTPISFKNLFGDF